MLRYVYKGKRFNKRNKERGSAFFVLPSGAVYEDHDGTTRRVGRMNGEGDLIPEKKYIAKFPERLEGFKNGEI